MPAPKGNRFWEARTSNKGAASLYSKPQDLEDACLEYFNWVADNPLQAAQPVTFQGKGDTFAVDKMRAMTIVGMCNFIKVGRATWYAWKDVNSEKHRKDVVDIIEWAEEIIYQQKFEGAAADLLNPNIIARELGLADKSELTGKVQVTKVVREIVDP